MNKDHYIKQLETQNNELLHRLALAEERVAYLNSICWREYHVRFRENDTKISAQSVHTTLHTALVDLIKHLQECDAFRFFSIKCIYGSAEMWEYDVRYLSKSYEADFYVYMNTIIPIEREISHNIGKTVIFNSSQEIIEKIKEYSSKRLHYHIV